MHHSTVLALSAALAAGASAQVNPRQPQLVDTTTTDNAILPSVASDGDLVAVAYGDTGTTTVNVVTSDGRALSWSAPVRVDQDPGSNSKITQFDSCAVFGSNVYVVWRDLRSGTARNDMYFNRSTDGGVTFGTEQVVDKGYPVGTGQVVDFAFAASSALDLYVLMTVDPMGTGANDELYLSSSHDGGVTWGTAVRVDSANADVDDIGIAADRQNPLRVHIAWADDRAGNVGLDDVWYRRSIDGGATFTAAEVQLDASGPLVGDAETEIYVRADGPIVGILWQEERASTANEEVRFTSSIDGGVTFSADQLVGGYTAGTHDVDWAALGLFGGTFYVGWEDDRSGADLLYVATTADFGITWRPDVVVSGPDGSVARFAGSPSGDIVGLAFTADVGNPDGTQAAFTEDRGLTWTTAQTLSNQPGNDIDFVEFGYNDRYRNFVSAWLENTGSAAGATRNRVWVGGFRPQTCTAVGWDDIYNVASTTLQFTCSGFGTDTIALIGIAQGPGPLTVIPDGRLWDLAPDATLASMFGTTAFVAPLTAGAGGTIALPNIFAGSGPPLGITYYFAAAGFDASGVGNLTDSFAIQL